MTEKAERTESGGNGIVDNLSAVSVFSVLLRLPPYAIQRSLELGTGSGRQAKSPKAGLILEEQGEAVAEIGPANYPSGGARARLDALIGRAQGNEHLAPIGAPAGGALVGEAGVGGTDPAEVLIQRLVLGCRRVGISLGVELLP